MRIVLAVVMLFSMGTIFGCGGATVRTIGANRYEIHSVISPKGSANKLFHQKARELCPNGYKIVTKNILKHSSSFDSEPTAFEATIECD